MKFIYGLVDPRNRQIRYIGQTDDLAKRLQQHIMDKSNTSKCEWIRGLLSASLRPEIIQLELVSDDENAHMSEYRWVYFGRKNGWELTNTVGMKSEDYYSLQGYFERLIVEMEKPENVVLKQHTMADAKQELVNLLVKSIKNIPYWLGVFGSHALSVVFCIASIFLSMAIGNFYKDNLLSGLTFFVAIFSIFATAILIMVWLIESSQKAQGLSKTLLRVVGFINICASIVVAFFG